MNGRNATIAALTKFVKDKATFSDDVNETDSGRIFECIKFIEHVVHDVVVVVCGRDRVNYVSSNCQSILGIDPAYFKSLSLVETIDLIHPDDVVPFKSCMQKLSKVIDVAYDQYKFVIHYRLKTKRESSLAIRDEKLAIETSPGKFVFITLLRNISDENIFSGVKLIIQKKKKDKFTTIDEFFPTSAARTLTPRQADIISLVEHGLSNKAIAERLKLSLSTVKNHKQILFKKIHVKSSIEMLSSIRNVSSEGRW